MLTVKSVMTQLTDPELILQRMSDTLRKIDPKFVHEEQKYFCAVDALKEVIGDTVAPSASEYIAAREQQICSELIYVAWLGFQQNLECFQNPINTMFLKMDYEDFHRERRMHTLPEVRILRGASYSPRRKAEDNRRHHGIHELFGDNRI